MKLVSTYSLYMLILELFQIKFIITNWINLRISGEVMLIELTLVRATGKISYVYTDVLKMNIKPKITSNV